MARQRNEKPGIAAAAGLPKRTIKLVDETIPDYSTRPVSTQVITAAQVAYIAKLKQRRPAAFSRVRKRLGFSRIPLTVLSRHQASRLIADVINDKLRPAGRWWRRP